MAIRIRIVSGYTIAICAAISEAKEGDIYLDDAIHHALTTKFWIDWQSEGLLTHSLADERLLDAMKSEQGGRLIH